MNQLLPLRFIPGPQKKPSDFYDPGAFQLRSRSDSFRLEFHPLGHFSNFNGINYSLFLIKLLKERYDRIILDTPPARPLSDVSLLSPFIDYVLWICRAGEIHRNNFVCSLQQIQQVQPNILGVVINAVDLQRDRYYYYGYPYYGYHSQRYYESEDQEPGETAGAEEKGEIHAPEVEL